MIKQLLSLSIVLIFVACASQPRIESDKDSEYDLSAYKSFKIDKPELTTSPSQIGLNPILMQRVERAIKSSLESKGLTESQEPDMVVRFFIGTNRSRPLNRYWRQRLLQ